MRPSYLRFLRTILGALAILAFVHLTTHGQAFAASESILWNFGNGTDGVNPAASLIRDASGNFYSTTGNGGAYGRGTVFELTPPSTSGGTWSESILWSFHGGTDGAFPTADLIMDKSGNLYGTTQQGGPYASASNPGGAVFELTPPSTTGGKWTESVLWSFGNGTDGRFPYAGLITDSSGNLYGTTTYGGTYGQDTGGYGTAFELTPPSTDGEAWTESVLWNFGNGKDGQNPYANLIMDSNGNLYSTTSAGGQFGNGGTVFELTPPSMAGGSWTESVIDGEFFYPGERDIGNLGGLLYAGLIMDTSGNLYGATQQGGFGGYGTVFELSPPTMAGGSWNLSRASAPGFFWQFSGGTDGAYPDATLIMDSGGNLYGTTLQGGAYGSNGTVFELTGPGAESILWEFGNGTDGANPDAGLIMDTSGKLYGTTLDGGACEEGTVFEISPSGSQTPSPTPTPTELTASAKLLNFGSIDGTGTSKPKKVTLTNQGNAPAEISCVTATAPFTIAGGPNTCAGETIAIKKTCSFYVEFRPTIAAELSDGSINVVYNGTSPMVTLKGTSIEVTLKAPKSESFPPESAGSIGKPKNIVISNPSTVTVTLGTAMLGGSDPGSFKISSDQCSGQPLASKGTCAIGVEFAPSGNASGAQSATLALGFTYGANQGNVSTDLSGRVK